MNTQEWTTINKYYQAVWTSFSPEKLAEVLDDDVVYRHFARDETVRGKEQVVESYRKYFFNPCFLDTTTIDNFSLRQGNPIIARYDLVQAHAGRGKLRGYVTEAFTLNSDNTKINQLTMITQFEN